MLKAFSIIKRESVVRPPVCGLQLVGLFFVPCIKPGGAKRGKSRHSKENLGSKFCHRYCFFTISSDQYTNTPGLWASSPSNLPIAWLWLVHPILKETADSLGSFITRSPATRSMYTTLPPPPVNSTENSLLLLATVLMGKKKIKIPSLSLKLWIPTSHRMLNPGERDFKICCSYS